jgi:integrase
MSKRGNGEGSIRQRKDGQWRAEILLGRKPNGKDDRRYLYGRTRGEDQTKLDDLRRRAAGGMLGAAEKERESVAAYLTGWLDGAKTSLRPLTWKRYSEIVTLHLIPGRGRHKIAALKPDHVAGLYARLRAGGLGPSTVHSCHRVLHRALGVAVRRGYLPRNVCGLIDPPKVPRTEIIPPTPEQIATLLDAAEAHGDRLVALWELAVYTGARQGELLALRWADLDLDRATISIRRTLIEVLAGEPTYGEPKSETSRRTLSLPPEAVAALRAHRDRQGFERQRLGDGYAAHDLVFATPIGGPLHNTSVWRSYKRALDRAGLPTTFRFHDLRHAHATAMLRAGVHMKVAQVRLGHGSIQITMDTYSHIQAGLDAEAADLVGAAFGRARRASTS